MTTTPKQPMEEVPSTDKPAQQEGAETSTETPVTAAATSVADAAKQAVAKENESDAETTEAVRKSMDYVSELIDNAQQEDHIPSFVWQHSKSGDFRVSTLHCDGVKIFGIGENGDEGGIDIKVYWGTNVSNHVLSLSDHDGDSLQETFESELDKLLKEKGILQEGQTLEDIVTDSYRRGY